MTAAMYALASMSWAVLQQRARVDVLVIFCALLREDQLVLISVAPAALHGHA